MISAQHGTATLLKHCVRWCFCVCNTCYAFIRSITVQIWCWKIWFSVCVCLCVRDNIELSKHTRSNKYNTLHACARSHTRPNTNLLIAFHIYSNLFALGMRAHCANVRAKAGHATKAITRDIKRGYKLVAIANFPTIDFFRSLLFSDMSMSSTLAAAEIYYFVTCCTHIKCIHRLQCKHVNLDLDVYVYVCVLCMLFSIHNAKWFAVFLPRFSFFSCDLFCVFRFRHNSIKSIAVWDGKI